MVVVPADVNVLNRSLGEELILWLDKCHPPAVNHNTYMCCALPDRLRMLGGGAGSTHSDRLGVLDGVDMPHLAT